MSPFGKLFWGFLVVLIDIRIKGFDLFVDLAGYLLIVLGLGELARRNAAFARARPYAVALMALSVFDLLTRSPTNATGSDAGLFGSSGLAIGFILALLVVNLMLVSNICRGIGEMARRIGDEHLATLSITRWQLFLITQVGGAIVFVLIFASPETFIGFGFVVVVAGLVAAILLAALFRRADKTFYPRRSR